MPKSTIALYIGLTLFVVGCSDVQVALPAGLCTDDSDCALGLCFEERCLDPASDDDVDGLTNGVEILLGTNPLNADTDGDGLKDGVEVGADPTNPLDQDGDYDRVAGAMRHDALESSTADADGDCIPDQADGIERDVSGDKTIEVCALEGLCAAEASPVAVCAVGDDGNVTWSCDYSGVSGYAPDDTSCDGIDNDCDGVVDEDCATNPCQPNCTDRMCGDDGCGGSCGTCSLAHQCGDDGTCSVIEDLCTVEEFYLDGPMTDGTVIGMVGQCLNATDPVPSGPSVVGQCIADAIVAEELALSPGCPDCIGAVFACALGNCMDPCTPFDPEDEVCTGCWENNSDNCSYLLENGCVSAVPCEPSCDGKVCGDDGCGGSCGSCHSAYACSDDQVSCDLVPDACTYSMGLQFFPEENFVSCIQDNASDDLSAVVEQAAACIVAGSEGSDGSEEPTEVCVSCLEAYWGCHVEVCAQTCIADIGGAGTACLDCLYSDPQSTICPAQFYDEGGCVSPKSCTPSCADKVCGDDGCGGSCGSCTAGESCEGGQCQKPCTPSCGNKVCGDDGCGGSCGSCGLARQCSAEGQCDYIPNLCTYQEFNDPPQGSESDLMALFIECFNSGPPLTDSAQLGECAAEIVGPVFGVSETCSSCYGALFECVYQGCIEVCTPFGDSTIEQCGECAQQNEASCAFITQGQDGCVFTCDVGEACDDGDPNTLNDFCLNNTCVGFTRDPSLSADSEPGSFVSAETAPGGGVHATFKVSGQGGAISAWYFKGLEGGAAFNVPSATELPALGTNFLLHSAYVKPGVTNQGLAEYIEGTGSWDAETVADRVIASWAGGKIKHPPYQSVASQLDSNLGLPTVVAPFRSNGIEVGDAGNTFQLKVHQCTCEAGSVSTPVGPSCWNCVTHTHNQGGSNGPRYAPLATVNWGGKMIVLAHYVTASTFSSQAAHPSPFSPSLPETTFVDLLQLPASATDAPGYSLLGYIGTSSGQPGNTNDARRATAAAVIPENSQSDYLYVVGTDGFVNIETNPSPSSQGLGNGLDSNAGEILSAVLEPLWAMDFIDITHHDGRIYALAFDKSQESFFLVMPEVSDAEDVTSWATERVELPFKQDVAPEENFDLIGTYYNYTAMAVEPLEGLLHLFGKVDENGISVPLHLVLPLPED